jgi:predicted transcriptional regulator
LAHYHTVQKLLHRLEAKGFVRRETDQLAHRFSAVVEREDLIGRRLRAMAERLCGGSVTALISGLVRVEPLKRGEIQELRALIDRLDRAPQRK